MSIYRIHNDDRYTVYHISSSEVINKLGRAYPIHIDHSPVRYADVWPDEFAIAFLADVDSDATEVPDISLSGGKLYLSEAAYAALGELLKNDGEFLAVQHQGGSGYLFNPLVIAEEHGALNSERTVYDPHGNLEHFEFIESALGSAVVFRTELDSFTGLFCQDNFKQAVSDTGLTGISFQPDLANFGGDTSDHSH